MDKPSWRSYCSCLQSRFKFWFFWRYFLNSVAFVEANGKMKCWECWGSWRSWTGLRCHPPIFLGNRRKFTKNGIVSHCTEIGICGLPVM